MINEGHAGWGLFSYYNQPNVITEYIMDNKPNYIFIQLGGNDAATGRRQLLNDSYGYLLDTIYQLDVNNTIIQIFMINFNWGLWFLDLTDEEKEEFFYDRSLYQNISKDYDLPLIDFFKVFENHTEYFIEGDGHINDLGQQVIAEQIHLQAAHVISPSTSTTSVSSTPSTASLIPSTDSLTSSTEERSTVSNSNETPFISNMMIISIIGVVTLIYRKKCFKEYQ